MLNSRRAATCSSFAAILLVILLSALPVFAAPQQSNDQAPAASLSNDQGEISSSQSPAAQQPSTSCEPAKDTQDKKDKDADNDKDKSPQDPKGTSDDRLFFALPNFLTVENAANIPPLTARQKFGVELRSTTDWGQFAWYGVLSALSQAQNSEPGYGQGWAGYGKRYGAAAADGTIENFMVGAVMPSIFHQDPRYFELGKGGFWHRTFYAMSRVVVTRGDSGTNQFNASEIFGSALSAGISTYSYHPHNDKTLGNTASVWGTQIGYDTLSLVVKEFWPDIRRKILRKNKTE